MPDNTLTERASAVMLTADRQIDRRILLQADTLEAAGWIVTIIAMPLDTSAEDDLRVVRIGTGIAHAKRVNRALEAYRRVRGHLPMNGEIVMCWLERLAWRYLIDQPLFYTRLFYDTVLRYSPSVFVAHDLPMLSVAKQAAKACGAKLVYDSHELFSEQEFSEREKRRWKEVEARDIGACDAVITVNQSIAAELQKRYDLGTVNVIYNAERTPDTLKRTRRFHETFALSSEKKVLLLQGGLLARRNLEVLVTAMGHVRDASVVLAILGDGPFLRKLHARVNSEKLSARVFFHPAVPQNELLQWTASADAGVIPYQATCLNNYFCTPNKLFEFIAVGLPILASDLPEIRRIVKGERIGLVGDTSSPQKLAALIDDFFSDKPRYLEWRHNLLEVRRRVCWEVEEKKLLEIYEVLR
uniref:Glycosyltransferase involved in cell wall bisynthesis n=1 Tax=Candidatus Kentrum sp. SD TaxID=2126332 RepID=A0A450YDE9_9GAMM|nr:MAG: Glycosyltransferase involved in cell wall bisynthesis [Candidatus Kentron sp. SD]VFK44540.1 MAG: Glycosyltransferase involved in cell wall bisynthesis [Candidatus Kentron sp. SD]